MKTKINFFAKVLTVLLFVFVSTSCEDLNVAPETQEQLSQNDQSSLTSQNTSNSRITGTYTDWSGDVEIVIVEGEDSGSHCAASVTVPTDYVLIGGGAHTTNTYQGAFLTESYPDGNTWHARTKDHIRSDPHTLTVYAIGLKLNGLTSTQLSNYIAHDDATSASGHYPNTKADVVSGYKLIGGGARTDDVNYSSGGSLLVHSYPNGVSWYAKSKDHKRSDVANIVAYSIGIKEYIPGFGYLDIQVNNASELKNTDYSNPTYNIPSGWVLACPGARATYTTKGRLLTSIKPTYNSVSSTSKDHIDADSGRTYAYAVRIRKRP